MQTQQEIEENDREKAHRRIARGLAVAFPIVLALLQLLPRPSMAIPRLDRRETMEANLAVPPPVAAMIGRACSNCHSNETRWPWYARMAPASWIMAKDVNEARKAMNLSRWASQNGRSPELAIATLTAACEDLRTGRMPTWNYRLLHPEAEVSKAEVDQFCGWATGEVRLLVRKKQQQTRGKTIVRFARSEPRP